MKKNPSTQTLKPQMALFHNYIVMCIRKCVTCMLSTVHTYKLSHNSKDIMQYTAKLLNILSLLLFYEFLTAIFKLLFARFYLIYHRTQLNTVSLPRNFTTKRKLHKLNTTILLLNHSLVVKCLFSWDSERVRRIVSHCTFQCVM